MKKKTVVLSLSGGMDSGTLLAYLLYNNYAVKCVNFQYGSKHNPYELKMAKRLAEYYNLKLYEYNLEPIFSQFKSNLLSNGGDIPEGHYEDVSMSQTVVPQRNMTFASLLAGIAESEGYEFVALGVHTGDHHIYPDCRKEFIKALDTSIYLSTNRKIEIIAPFIDMNKTLIIELGISIDMPYQLTRTCYKAQELSCGLCGSCVERLEAFDLNGITDPIEYE